MTHQGPGTQGLGRSFQPNLHPDSLAWDKLSRQYGCDSPLAKIDRPSRQGIWNSRAQHGYIQRDLRRVSGNAPPRRFVPAQRLCSHCHKLMYSPPGALSGTRFQRCNSVISLPLATSTVLAMPINNPCSTTPGMSLSCRAKPSASGICPKWQSRIWLFSSVTNGFPPGSSRNVTLAPRPVILLLTSA